MNRFSQAIRVRWRRYRKARKRQTYLTQRIPWSVGYNDYKWEQIDATLQDPQLMKQFSQGDSLPQAYELPEDQLIEQITQTHHYAQQNFTRERFYLDMKSFIIDAIETPKPDR